jgi:hypothetical protein
MHITFWRESQSRDIKIWGPEATMTMLVKASKNLSQNRKREKPLGRPRRTLEENIKTDLKDIVWDDMDWIHLGTSGRGSCEHGNEP